MSLTFHIFNYRNELDQFLDFLSDQRFARFLIFVQVDFVLFRELARMLRFIRLQRHGAQLDINALPVLVFVTLSVRVVQLIHS